MWPLVNTTLHFLQDNLTLAASVVVQQDVACGAGAEVCAGLVHTLMLAEELREAALVHIWGVTRLHLLFTTTKNRRLAASYANSRALQTQTIALLSTSYKFTSF